MSLSRRVARARLGVLALTAVLLLALGVVPALARSAGAGPAADLRDWLTRAMRALARGETTRVAAPGDTIVVFGPKQAATPTGASATTVEQFAVPTADAGRRYLLRVENGATDGGARVSTGTVQLNGATVVTSAELAALGSGASLFASITVPTSTNTLVATVQGTAGSHLTLSVVTAPDPTFTVWGPKSYERTNGTPVTVTERFTLPAGAGTP
ncbi:MAG: hypothetical protein LH467_05275, partial [Gemmatimonadaceae bacterium]|nr:hypothetical protein [Gemmatimonadaceae bacterium]